MEKYVLYHVSVLFYAENQLIFAGVYRWPENAAKKQEYLADQQTVQISADSGGGDEKKDTGDPYAEAEKVEQKRTGSLSQSVDHAEKYSVRIQKRTDPCECQNKISGKRTFEQKNSNPFSEYQKNTTTKTSKQNAGTGDF